MIIVSFLRYTRYHENVFERDNRRVFSPILFSVPELAAVRVQDHRRRGGRVLLLLDAAHRAPAVPRHVAWLAQGYEVSTYVAVNSFIF